MDGNNHYIRVDANNIVIDRYSEWEGKYQPGDILVESNGQRHYNIPITDGQGNLVYKWNGTQMVSRTNDADYLLAVAKTNKLAEIQTAATNALQTFTSSALGPVHTYLCGQTDMILLESEDRFMQGPDYDNQPVLWYTTDSGDISHTKAQLHQVYLDGRSAVQRKKYMAKNLVTQATTAADAATVNAINVAGANWS